MLNFITLMRTLLIGTNLKLRELLYLIGFRRLLDQ